MRRIEPGRSVEPDSQPAWRKLWEFPLTALGAALALTLGAIELLGRAMAGLPEVLGQDGSIAVQAVVAVAALFALYKLAIRHLGERRYDDLVLGDAAAGLAKGAGLGTALMAAVVAAAWLLGSYRVLGRGKAEDAVEIVFAGGLAAAFIEELLFRGILFRWIEEFAGTWAALSITSALFGLAHLGNDNATAFSSLAIALEAGVLLGAAYVLARSLWLPMGLHLGWNVSQGLVFDVPVSGHPVRGLVEAQLSGPRWLTGGAFGLEASVLALAVAGSAGIWLSVKAVKAGRIMPPRWRRQS